MKNIISFMSREKKNNRAKAVPLFLKREKCKSEYQKLLINIKKYWVSTHKN